MSGLRDDLRWAFRYARRRPIFAIGVTLTLAIVIAAATTAFGLATAILWRPLPFHDASQLVFVWEESSEQPTAMRVTGARHAAWRDASSGLASLALFGAAGFTVESRDGAQSIHGVRVSANYFETLGMRAMVGRTFAPADEEPGNHRVVVLSHALWQERFGGRRDAVGETLRLNGDAYTVIGVMPPETFPAWPVNPAHVTLDADSRQFWVPIPHTPELDRTGRAHVFGVIARLTPGVSMQDATERLNRTSDASATDPHRARIEPLREQFVATARTPLVALAGAALAVLLIACTNLAALYVSAFESRRGELAVRAAIGAGISRLVRQLAIESWLLASIGGLGGLAISRVALAVIPRLLPASIPFLTRPIVDLPTVAFAFVLALLAGAILTGWPIARLMTSAPSPRGTVMRPRSPVYRALVITQVAITVALVAAAGLLAQSIRAVERRDTGFAVDHVFVADIGLPSRRPPDGAGIALSERNLLEAVAARPGVRAVAAAYDHPLEANWSETLTILGDTTADQQRRAVELRIVSPGYFDALDVAVVDGRAFTERDALGVPGVAIVNEALARELGGRVLGRRIQSAPPRFLYGTVAAAEFEIVGVVANERFRGLEQPTQPAYYLSTRQFPQTSFSLLVRTDGDPVAVAPDIRAAVRTSDAATTFNHATSLDRILAEQLAQRRVTTDIIGGFATAALTLAALGLYALLAAAVGSRRREIGVRLAIGASPASVAQFVVGEGLRSAFAGIALGSVLSLAVGRLIQSLLVGVTARDPRTLATVAGLLFLVALVAALAPAFRAARIDPAEALRAE